MVISDALIPVPRITPSSIDINRFDIGHHRYSRSPQKIELIRINNKDDDGTVYGPNGQNVLETKNGKIIDIFA